MKRNTLGLVVVAAIALLVGVWAMTASGGVGIASPSASSAKNDSEKDALLDVDEPTTPLTMPADNRGPVPEEIQKSASEGNVLAQIGKKVWEEGGEVVVDKDGNWVAIDLPGRVPDGLRYPNQEYEAHEPWDIEPQEVNPPLFLAPEDLEKFQKLMVKGDAFRLIQGLDGYLHVVVAETPRVLRRLFQSFATTRVATC